jgi:hypothetical protein
MENMFSVKSETIPYNEKLEDNYAYWHNLATVFLGEISVGAFTSRLGESHKLRQQNMVMSPAGLRPEKDCAGEALQHLKTTDLTCHQRRSST